MEETEYIKQKIQEMQTTIDACCLLMGVSDGTKLFNAVELVDKAIKAFVRGHDGGEMIYEWWNSREF